MRWFEQQTPDSKKEQFRKYLEKSGVIDALTKGIQATVVVEVGGPVHPLLPTGCLGATTPPPPIPYLSLTSQALVCVTCFAFALFWRPVLLMDGEWGVGCFGV